MAWTLQPEGRSWTKAEILMQSLFSIQPAQRTIPVKISAPALDATIWEQALLVVWFFSLSMPLPELGLVRYLCIASLLGIFAWHNRETVPLALKSWPLFLVPIMTLLSIFWTPYPEKAVSTGILVLLTPIILITIAARMRAPDFLRVMMLGGTLAALYCIPYYATLPDGGPYAQKNVLAYQMMIVTLISFSVLLNEGENLLIR